MRSVELEVCPMPVFEVGYDIENLQELNLDRRLIMDNI